MVLSIAAMASVRDEWLTKLVREIQIIAGAPVADLSKPAIIEARVLRTLNRRIAEPSSPLESLCLRGLVAQAALKASARPLTLDQYVTRGPAVIARRRVDDSDLARRAKALIDSECAQLSTVEGIAGHVGCHPVHLERVFGRMFGTPVHRYLRFVRVQQSMRFLADRTLKIEAIPSLVGFKGKATFYRAVKEFTGRPPGYWRRSRG